MSRASMLFCSAALLGLALATELRGQVERRGEVVERRGEVVERHGEVVERRGEVARQGAQRAQRAASRRSQTRSRESRMWSDLAPNYKGRQTYGLEMESDCVFKGPVLNDYADYAALAMVVYRRATPGGKRIPLGMLEIEGHGNLEAVTFPAHAMRPEDTKDVQCMVYFAFRLHRKTKQGKVGDTLAKLVKQITEVDAKDPAVVKPDGCDHIEVAFGKFDPSKMPKAEHATSGAMAEEKYDNNGYKIEGEYVCVGYRESLVQNDLPEDVEFCDFSGIQIKQQCLKSIFPQLNAHVNLRKFYGPEGAGMKLLNRPAPGPGVEAYLKKKGLKPEDFFFSRQAAKEKAFFSSFPMLPKTDEEFEKLSNEMLSVPDHRADLSYDGRFYVVPDGTRYRPGFQANGHGVIASGKPLRWPSPVDPLTKKTPFTICDVLYNIKHEINMNPLWVENTKGSSFMGAMKNFYNWLPKFMINEDVMRQANVHDQEGVDGEICMCPARSTKWAIGDDVDPHSGEVSTEPCEFDVRASGIPMVEDCPKEEEPRHQGKKHNKNLRCSTFGLVELRAYPHAAITQPLVYGMRVDQTTLQSGEELGVLEKLQKSEAIASRDLLARIEKFTENMRKFHTKVMTHDRGPAAAGAGETPLQRNK